MNNSNTWAVYSSLIWLEKILFERFGHALSLEITDNCTIKLKHGSTYDYIELVVDGETYCRRDSDLSCPEWDAAIEGWNPALEKKLPAPGAKHLPSPLIQSTSYGFSVGYDILGLTYWMLSRQEEVERTDLDEHGRFPAASSHAYKHGYLERPVVDEWLHILGQVIQRTWPSMHLKKHQFSMKVSHDVDVPSRYAFRSLPQVFRIMAGDVIKRREFKNALMAFWIKIFSKKQLHPADPENTFNWIMDISDRHGLKSAFYFICGRTDASKDADYDPEHAAIRKLMTHIYQRGHEIGLHPSYGSYKNPEIISLEAQRLRKIAFDQGIIQPEWGGRMHFLRWEQPTTLNGWVMADMTYDSTMSYADLPGFRCGTCFEYQAFDPVEKKSIQLRIRPLIAMECTIIAPRYMGLGTGIAAQKKFMELKQKCRSVNGCFTLLWHNSSFTSAAEKNLYINLFE